MRIVKIKHNCHQLPASKQTWKRMGTNGDWLLVTIPLTFRSVTPTSQVTLLNAPYQSNLWLLLLHCRYTRHPFYPTKVKNSKLLLVHGLVISEWKFDYSSRDTPLISECLCNYIQCCSLISNMFVGDNLSMILIKYIFLEEIKIFKYD